MRPSLTRAPCVHASLFAAASSMVPSRPWGVNLVAPRTVAGAAWSKLPMHQTDASVGGVTSISAAAATVVATAVAATASAVGALLPSSAPAQRQMLRLVSRGATMAAWTSLLLLLAPPLVLLLTPRVGPALQAVNAAANSVVAASGSVAAAAGLSVGLVAGSAALMVLSTEAVTRMIMGKRYIQPASAPGSASTAGGSSAAESANIFSPRALFQAVCSLVSQSQPLDPPSSSSSRGGRQVLTRQELQELRQRKIAELAEEQRRHQQTLKALLPEAVLKQLDQVRMNAAMARTRLHQAEGLPHPPMVPSPSQSAARQHERQQPEHLPVSTTSGGNSRSGRGGGVGELLERVTRAAAAASPAEVHS